VAAFRIALACVFLWACAYKIVFPRSFAVAIFRYHLLPHGLINVAAVFIPWLELVTAVALLFGRRYVPAAAVITLGLLAVFTVAIGVNLVRGIDMGCGCFTSSPDAGAIGPKDIVKNIIMMALAAAVIWYSRCPPRTTPGAAR
jgi:hypothetical protein